MRHAALAQPAERLTRNEKVSGSIPLGGSGIAGNSNRYFTHSSTKLHPIEHTKTPRRSGAVAT